MRTYRSHLVPLSPAILVAVANAFVGVGEQGGTGSCEALAGAARAHGVVGVQDEALVHERCVHVCVTVEGNTNDDGSANGHTTPRKVRTFREAEGHRFIRWVEMGRRVAAA